LTKAIARQDEKRLLFGFKCHAFAKLSYVFCLLLQGSGLFIHVRVGKLLSKVLCHYPLLEGAGQRPSKGLAPSINDLVVTASTLIITALYSPVGQAGARRE